MSEELKPCPFCGSEAIPNNFEPERVNCSNPGCYNSSEWRDYGFSIDNWNTRPIEDALRKQLDVAKDLLIRLEIATNLRKSIYETPLHAFKAVHSEVIKALAEINRLEA